MKKTKTILILAANPEDTTHLRLDKEAREIDNGLKRAKNRNQFVIQKMGAVTAKDLRRALLDYEPQIVHFCGHGDANGIILENENGGKEVVKPEALSDLFEVFAKRIECVILNACYSERQAEAISEHINYVIGMEKEIGDEAAIEFAIGFYDGLGAGKSIEESFKLGCNAIHIENIPEHLTPVLKKKTDNLPSQVQLIIESDIRGFSEATQYTLIKILAAILNVNHHSIKILHVMAGSIRVIIELPNDSAQELIHLFNTKSKKLEQLISQFRVQEIQMLRQSHGPNGTVKYPKFLEWQNKAVQLISSKSWTRRVAFASVIAVPILVATGFAVWKFWQSRPSDKLIILVANFEGPDPHKYHVADFIRAKLNEVVQEYNDVEVKPLSETIRSSEAAKAKGKAHKASIVLWGSYFMTGVKAFVDIHFEVLERSRFLSLAKDQETLTADIAELEHLALQAQLSGKMNYLSLMTIGLVRYGKKDYDGAIDGFTRALTQQPVPEEMIDPVHIYHFRGRSYLLKGDNERAIADNGEAIRLNPNSVDAYSNRGIAYAQKGDFEKAIADFQQTIRLKPKDAKGYNNLAVAYKLKGETARAIDNFKKAVAYQPGYLIAIKNLAIASAEEGKFKLAISNISQVIADNPRDADGYTHLGCIYYSKGDLDSAIFYFNQAITIDAKNADAFFNRGRTYFKRKDLKSAIADFDQAIILQPKNADIYYYRGLAYYENNDFERAIADFDQVISLQINNAEAYYYRGLAHYKKLSYDRAIADFDQAIILQPKNAEAYYNRGLANFMNGNYDRAIAAFQQTITLEPKHAGAYHYLGRAYYEKKNYKQAITNLTQAIALHPNAETYYNRGSVYYTLVSNEQANADFEKACQLKPDSTFVFYAAFITPISPSSKIVEQATLVKQQADNAKSYYDSGNKLADSRNYRSAIDNYSRAIALVPDFAEAYFKRGVVYYKQRDYDRAIADFDQVITLQPKNAEAYYHRGLAFQAKGKLKNAIVDFNKTLELHPNHKDALNARARLNTAEKDYDAALTDLKQIIALNPNDVEAYCNRGNLYSSRGDFDDAIASYDQAIRLKPDYAEAFYRRGDVYSRIGKFNPALSDLELAIQLKPNLFDAYISLGRVYADKGQVDRATEIWNKAIRLDPTDLTKGKAFNELALYFARNKNDLKIALKLTEFSLKYKPHEPTFLATLAEIYYRLGDFKKAEKENDNARKYAQNDEGLIRSIEERAQKINNRMRWQ